MEIGWRRVCVLNFKFDLNFKVMYLSFDNNEQPLKWRQMSREFSAWMSKMHFNIILEPLFTLALQSLYRYLPAAPPLSWLLFGKYNLIWKCYTSSQSRHGGFLSFNHSEIKASAYKLLPSTRFIIWNCDQLNDFGIVRYGDAVWLQVGHMHCIWDAPRLAFLFFHSEIIGCALHLLHIYVYVLYMCLCMYICACVGRAARDIRSSLRRGARGAWHHQSHQARVSQLS